MLKFIKLGFWRPHDHTTYKIWNGYMSRSEAVEIVNKIQYEFPAYLEEFLEYHQLSENIFFNKVEQLRNHDIWIKRDGIWKLRYELQ